MHGFQPDYENSVTKLMIQNAFDRKRSDENDFIIQRFIHAKLGMFTQGYMKDPGFQMIILVIKQTFKFHRRLLKTT